MMIKRKKAIKRAKREWSGLTQKEKDSSKINTITQLENSRDMINAGSVRFSKL